MAVMRMERGRPTGKTHISPIPKVLFAWIYKKERLTHLLVLREETILSSTLQVFCLPDVFLDHLSTLSVSTGRSGSYAHPSPTVLWHFAAIWVAFGLC